MRNAIDHCLDLLFPPRCANCRRRGALLCAACRSTCRFVPARANAEQHARLASPHLESTAGAYIFEGAVREAIHTLKYNRKQRMARPLADLLARYLHTYPITVDAIVPVPLHEKRQHMRGFNQAQAIAAQLARNLGIPLLADSVVRVRHTAQQADLSRAARRDNVRDAFQWRGPLAPPPRILVLDDVLTTGATVEAVAAALRIAGAREVHALAVARGL